MWKQGLEAPVDGTSVKEWPILSRSQCENFISVGIVTVEDIAAMTEEAMARIGMGSRALRDQARDWLKGKEIASAAIAENAELKKKLEELQEQVNQLMQDKPEKRGRKAKEETTP
jgi:hypothetical protein